MLLPPAAPLNVAPCYLALGDLAGRLGVPVTVAPTLAKRTYAVSLAGASAEGVLGAIAADGTVEVTRSGDRWALRPSTTAAARIRGERRRYLDLVARTSAAAYPEAKRRLDAILGLPEAEIDASLRSLDGKPPSAAARIVFSYFDDQDSGMRYARATLPPLAAAALASDALIGLGSVADNDSLLSPPGSPFSAFSPFAGLPPPERARQLRKIPLSLDARLDPQSGWASYALYGEMVFDWSRFVPGARPYPAQERLANGPFIVSPADLPLDRAKVFGPAREAEIAKASAASAALVAADPRLSKEGREEGKGRVPSRLSDALLRRAGETGVSLVFRPSAFFDPRDAGFAGRSLAGMLALGGEERTIRADALRRIGSRLGVPSQGDLGPVRLVPRFAFVRAGDVLSVTHDLGFLDAFAATDPVVSPAIGTHEVRGEPIPLSEVLAAVAALDPARWPIGAMPSAVLDRCDPNALFPFAVLARTSAPFRAALASLRTNRFPELRLETLAPADYAAFADAFAPLARTHIGPADGPGLSASHARADLQGLGAASFRINAESTGIDVVLELVRHNDSETIWSATVLAPSL